MRLLTERLVLEGLTPPMAQSMLEGKPSAGDVWAPGYPMSGELDLMRDYLSLSHTSIEDSLFGLFVIRLRPGRVAVGGIGFFGPPDDSGGVEFGYGLVPAARGRGLATEALRVLLKAAADRGALVARAATDLDNFPSQRVLQRVGMREVRRDAHLTYWSAVTAKR